MQESEVVLHKGGGVTLAGPDAIALYRAATLKVSLRMYARSGLKMTRTATPTVMLKIATEITGHKYKRGAYLEAAKDLEDWIATMKTALPYRDERSPTVGEEA